MNKKGEKYLYIENKSGYSFILLAILINGAGVLYSMDRIVINRGILWYVLLNIVMTLFIFLAGTEQKMYSKRWSYAAIGAAVLQLGRMAFLPDFKGADTLMLVNISLVLSAACLVAGSVLTLKKAHMREKAAELQANPVN